MSKCPACEMTIDDDASECMHCGAVGLGRHGSPGSPKKLSGTSVVGGVLLVGCAMGIVYYLQIFEPGSFQEFQDRQNGLILYAFGAVSGLGLLLYRHAQKNGSPNVVSRSGLPIVPPRDERECPHCAERILAHAKVCKHCGRDVAATDVAVAAAPRSAAVPQTAGASSPQAEPNAALASPPVRRVSRPLVLGGVLVLVVVGAYGAYRTLGKSPSTPRSTARAIASAPAQSSAVAAGDDAKEVAATIPLPPCNDSSVLVTLGDELSGVSRDWDEDYTRWALPAQLSEAVAIRANMLHDARWFRIDDVMEGTALVVGFSEGDQRQMQEGRFRIDAFRQSQWTDLRRTRWDSVKNAYHQDRLRRSEYETYSFAPVSIATIQDGRNSSVSWRLCDVALKVEYPGSSRDPNSFRFRYVVAATPEWVRYRVWAGYRDGIGNKNFAGSDFVPNTFPNPNPR